MIFGKNIGKARKQAQTNADYFGVPYVVFTDTSLNVRVERYDETLTCHREGEKIIPAVQRTSTGEMS